MITVKATPMMAIRLGRLGENERLRVAFDVSALQTELPGASFTIINQGPGDATAYPCPGVTIEDGVLYWPITSAELQQTGRGRCELIVTVGDVVAKSVIYGTEILEALDGSGEAPEPWDSWQTEFAEMVADAQTAAAEAAESVEHYPHIEDGVWMVWDAQSGDFVSTGVEATGPRGNPGQKGDPGYTPQKGVDYFDGAPGEPGKDGKNGQDGYTPVKGVDYFDGQDGKDGKDGQPGQPGTDGFSPTVTVTDITGGHRITITDADGAHSFDVMDGDAADAPVQSVNGKTGVVVLNATDVGAGTYSKPSEGIPASDLAAGVIPIVPVQDVQVAGASVLSSGVANVPIADTDNPGTVKIGESMVVTDGVLDFRSSGASDIIAATSTQRALTPKRQHEAVFFGLAKVAGDTTQQSAGASSFGNYTEDAKSAISQMLNGSVSVSGTMPTVTALPGIRYVCGEVATLSFTPSATGICDVVFTSGSTPTVLTVPNTVKWPAWFDPTALEANTTYELNIMGGVYGAVGVWT